uniref:Galactose-1-phosphate uridylyltransferase n=1 Tax=Bionectria ochroleuca TaxID=29856 RepID=A0A0B7JU87_BIOOC
MPDKVLDDISHRRYNPLTDSWLLVSPHRTKRPWQGQQEAAVESELPEYDPKVGLIYHPSHTCTTTHMNQCYLCPGNSRAAGDRNPQYEKTFAFVNDYSAVKEQQPDYENNPSSDDPESWLLQAQGVKGVCYVLTFSPKHHLTLADLPGKDILPIVEHWTRIYANHLSAASPLAKLAQELDLSLGTQDAPVPKDEYRYMQIFENKGAAMGCSNPHPHCQVESSYLHMHFYPPLLRSATVRKFLVGYELMAEPQRDITPEQAAARLRDCGGPLYRGKVA